jgi:hypothetical protein
MYRMIPQGTLNRRHQRAAVVPSPKVSAPKKQNKRETRHSRLAKLEQLKVRAPSMRWAA